MVAAVVEAFSATPPDPSAPLVIPPAESQPAQTAAPTQEAAPTDAQVVQPEVTPEGINPEGTVPALPDTPEVQKLLEMYGGDLARAAKEALGTNTRATQYANKLRELGIDPKTMLPYPVSTEPVQEVEQPLPQPLDSNEVERYVQDIIGRDANFANLRTQYQAFEGQKGEVQARLATIAEEKREAQIFLKHPATAADTFEKERLTQVLRDLNLEEITLQNREVLYENKQAGLSSRAEFLRKKAEEVVVGSLREQAEQRANDARSSAIIAQSEAEWNATFPVAIEQAMKEFNLPSQMLGNLANRARAQGLMQDGPIENIHGFVKGVAKEMSEELVSFHRLQSAAYATQANTRTAQAASPGSTANTVLSPGAQSGKPLSLAEHEANMQNLMAEAMRGGGTL
jgi:hypothetical protein